MKAVSFKNQNKYCLNSENICATAGKELYLLLWAPWMAIAGISDIQQRAITIRAKAAKKATEDHLC